MKTGWKSLVVAGIVFSVACSMVMAKQGTEQDKDRPAGQKQLGPEPGAGIARFIRKLDLTQEQRTAIREILAQAKPEAQAAHEAVVQAREDLHTAVTSGATEEQIRAAAAVLGTVLGNQATLHAATLASIKAVLTDEQKSKLEQLQKELPPVDGGQRKTPVKDGEDGQSLGPVAFKRLFNAADADKDGVLTAGEVRAFAQANEGKPAAATLKRLFKAADADEDGTLTTDEVRAFAQAKQGGQSLGPVAFKRLFNAADADKDGVLTADEVRAFAQAHEGKPAAAALKRLFKAADADKDGTLTADELKTFEQARKNAEQPANT